MKQIDDTVLPNILGRSESLFESDFSCNLMEMRDTVRGSKILVIGAAGSIGAAFVKVVADFSVDTLHLVDISENSLVEVVRDLRASGKTLPDRFRTFAIDFSQSEFHALLAQNSYDFVLNFAALKHVRSERDPFTLMRLINVNVLGNASLVDRLVESNTPHLFAVSSDKSVRPANLMGASKALMERLLLRNAASIKTTSARFANVAFSTGSLLDGFLRRIERRQPLSAPNDVRRYFISHKEAGQLCFMGCFLGANREIFFPQLDSRKDMMSFADIARVLLETQGYSAFECGSESEAIERSKQLKDNSREWPCYFSESDTSGEKPFEEFVNQGEHEDLSRFSSVGVVTNPTFHGDESLDIALETLSNMRDSAGWNINAIVDAVRIAVPELDHVVAGRDLDQKL